MKNQNMHNTRGGAIALMIVLLAVGAFAALILWNRKEIVPSTTLSPAASIAPVSQKITSRSATYTSSILRYHITIRTPQPTDEVFEEAIEHPAQDVAKDQAKNFPDLAGAAYRAIFPGSTLVAGAVSSDYQPLPRGGDFLEIADFSTTAASVMLTIPYAEQPEKAALLKTEDKSGMTITYIARDYFGERKFIALVRLPQMIENIGILGFSAATLQELEEAMATLSLTDNE